MSDFSHISFKTAWRISKDCSYMLGECHSLSKALSSLPLHPNFRQELLRVSLIKGAHATTSIEGNTLSEEDINKIQEGWVLPPSKEYLGIEVNNILDAFNQILKEVVSQQKNEMITPEMIKRFHAMIGKNLGEHFDAIPGRFREDSRMVNRYMAPDHRKVPSLVKNLCEWIHLEFHYEQGQTFVTAVIQAIVTHVYLEWIHPFGDGNGRTGRLLEFYILLRAGLPNIASHILSNYYNETRTEYYRQLDIAGKKQDLTEFIEYAIRGFRDGLKLQLDLLTERQFEIYWRHHIYEIFARLKFTKKDAFKRKRNLILEMPLDEVLSLEEISLLSPSVARDYGKVGRSTLLRDLRELVSLDLLKKNGRKYSCNISLLGNYIPLKKI